MHLVIGCDEAGYGPNLGPLVISASAWRLPEGADADCDLYTLLSEVVCPRIEKSPPAAARRLAIADSKLLYQSGGDFRYLEEAVHVALGCLGQQAATWRALWPLLARGCEAEIHGERWHEGYDAPLPLHADLEETEQLAQRFAAGQQAAAVELMALRSDTVFPTRFNALCQRLGSKGLLLSTCTLRLVAGLIRDLPAEQVTVLADKHGGRNRYAALIQAALDDRWVEVRFESRNESCYRIRGNGQTIDFYFRVGGEAALPTAWASLCSKYLRELAVEAFNHYWQSRVANLRRTAGYPGDAARFMADIAEALAAEGIAHDAIWRQR